MKTGWDVKGFYIQGEYKWPSLLPSFVVMQSGKVLCLNIHTFNYQNFEPMQSDCLDVLSCLVTARSKMLMEKSHFCSHCTRFFFLSSHGITGFCRNCVLGLMSAFQYEFTVSIWNHPIPLVLIFLFSNFLAYMTSCFFQSYLSRFGIPIRIF
jgi:hypothetical protein